ncbi:MAG: type II toxin-antitoxin system VapC family toxin [Opitutales bacterium]|nr:type II toxin-antitoxin system VapC family toxin [Opitutales bacterium]
MARESVRYLLDTNILSHLMRYPTGRVRTHIEAVGEESVATSIIVACEIRYGARKRAAAKLTRHVETVLANLLILPIEEGVDTAYAGIRFRLESKGSLIGPNDLLIAAHARALGLTLVTDNEDEFRRISGLRVENWIRDATAWPER